MTNHLFMKTDLVFQGACSLAGVKETKRQASKFRNGKGSAFPFKGESARLLLDAEETKKAAALDPAGEVPSE